MSYETLANIENMIETSEEIKDKLDLSPNRI